MGTHVLEEHDAAPRDDHWNGATYQLEGNKPPTKSGRRFVSGFIFTLWWWFIFCMHFFNGSLALAFAAIYLFFSLPAIYPTVALLEVPLQLLQISGWSYLLLACGHWYYVVRLVWWSSRRKELTFKSPPTSCGETQRESLLVFVKIKHWAFVLYCWFWTPWNRLFGIDGIFGMNGDYFHLVFFAREALEIGLQTYQANQLSRAVRRPWITHLAVATLVLNAFSSPAVWFLLRRKPESLRRFTGILVDMCLDFCSAAIIPLCVVYPLLAGYDTTTGLLPDALIYDDTWLMSSIAEIRQFCVTSPADLLATMMPHVTVLTCLNAAKKAIRRRSTNRSRETSILSHLKLKRFVQSMVVVSRIVPTASTTTNFVRDLGSKDSASWPLQLALWLETARNLRLLKVYYACSVIWALGVIVVHSFSFVHAKSTTVVGCRLMANAWLTQQAPCTVMHINCHRDHILGSSDEISAAVALLDRSLLKKLIFAHCPELEIPPVVGEFVAVSELDIYNSTLLSWPKEAAVTPSTLSSLITFHWFACPYISFPDGLLHSNLPKSFAQIVITKSNLTELPDDLGTLWADHPLDNFSVQLSSLRRLPTTFRDLQVSKLSIITTEVTEIADDALANKALHVLQLSGNPITRWPSTVGDTSELVEVMAEHTLLQSLSPQLSEWWNAGFRTRGRPITMSLFGSPVCDDAVLNADFPCRADQSNAEGTYRWDLIEVQRALDL